MNRTIRSLAVQLMILGLAGAYTASAQERCTINEFGGPRRFADQGAQTLSALQGVFEVHRQDIENLLGDVDWQGEPKDLFNAVANGNVQESEFPPGTPFQWMMLRYKGVAQITLDKCWGGREAFSGWSITVESGGYRSNFIVPKDCGNFALTGTEKLPPPPPPPTPEPEPTPEPVEPEPTEVDDAAAAAAAAAAMDSEESSDAGDQMAEADSGLFSNCRIRLFGAKSYASDRQHTAENVGTIDEERTDTKIENGSGGGVEGECMVTPKLGIPLALMFLSQDAHIMYDDVNVWLMDSTDVDWMALTTGVNYHFMKPESKFDLFIGPFIGYVNFSDPSYTLGEEKFTARLDDEFTWGVHLGFDVPGRKGWAFYGGVRYFDLGLEVQGDDIEFEVDPVVVGAGVTYKF